MQCICILINRVKNNNNWTIILRLLVLVHLFRHYPKPQLTSSRLACTYQKCFVRKQIEEVNQIIFFPEICWAYKQSQYLNIGPFVNSWSTTLRANNWVTSSLGTRKNMQAHVYFAGSCPPSLHTDLQQTWPGTGQSQPFIWYGAALIWLLNRGVPYGSESRHFHKQTRWPPLMCDMLVPLICVQQHFGLRRLITPNAIKIKRFRSNTHLKIGLGMSGWVTSLIN